MSVLIGQCAGWHGTKLGRGQAFVALICYALYLRNDLTDYNDYVRILNFTSQLIIIHSFLFFLIQFFAESEVAKLNHIGNPTFMPQLQL